MKKLSKLYLIFAMLTMLLACNPGKTLTSLELSLPETIKIGSTNQVQVIFKNNAGEPTAAESLTWASSNPNVVSVDQNGNLVAKHLNKDDKPIGITATAKNGVNKTINISRTYGLDVNCGTLNSTQKLNSIFFLILRNKDGMYANTTDNKYDISIVGPSSWNNNVALTTNQILANNVTGPTPTDGEYLNTVTAEGETFSNKCQITLAQKLDPASITITSATTDEISATIQTTNAKSFLACMYDTTQKKTVGCSKQVANLSSITPANMFSKGNALTSFAPGNYTLDVFAYNNTGSLSPSEEVHESWSSSKIFKLVESDAPPKITNIDFAGLKPTLLPKEKITLTPTLAGQGSFNKNVHWTVSPENAGTFSTNDGAGEVVFNASATEQASVSITATSVGDTTISKTQTTKIVAATDNAVASLTIVVSEKLKLKETVQAQVIAKNAAGQIVATPTKIEWSSSDTKIVAVDASGNLTAADYTRNNDINITATFGQISATKKISLTYGWGILTGVTGYFNDKWGLSFGALYRDDTGKFLEDDISVSIASPNGESIEFKEKLSHFDAHNVSATIGNYTATIQRGTESHVEKFAINDKANWVGASLVQENYDKETNANQLPIGRLTGGVNTKAYQFCMSDMQYKLGCTKLLTSVPSSLQPTDFFLNGNQVQTFPTRSLSLLYINYGNDYIDVPNQDGYFTFIGSNFHRGWVGGNHIAGITKFVATMNDQEIGTVVANIEPLKKIKLGAKIEGIGAYSKFVHWHLDSAREGTLSLENGEAKTDLTTDQDVYFTPAEWPTSSMSELKSSLTYTVVKADGSNAQTFGGHHTKYTEFYQPLCSDQNNWQLKGSAVDPSTLYSPTNPMPGANSSATQFNSIVLTKDTAGLSGMAVAKNPVKLDKSFSCHYQVYLGSKDKDGADGLAYVWLSSSVSTYGNNNAGGNIGFGFLTNFLLGAEIDTWKNDYDLAGNDSNDHLGLLIGTKEKGNQIHQTSDQVKDIGNVEDNKLHDLYVRWVAQKQTLSFYFDPSSTITEVAPAAQLSTTIIGGLSEVYPAFTSSTGASSNLHYIVFDESPKLGAALNKH